MPAPPRSGGVAGAGDVVDREAIERGRARATTTGATATPDDVLLGHRNLSAATRTAGRW